jgi:hypothetical protein
MLSCFHVRPESIGYRVAFAMRPRQLAVLVFLAGAAGLCLWLAPQAVSRFRGFFSFARPQRVQEVALADLNGDGSLDAYLTINPDGEPYLHPDYVLFNDGAGEFEDSGQLLGNTNSFSVALGDVNGDGSIDAVAGNRIYKNNGEGVLYGSTPLRDVGSGGTFRWEVALADLDGNGSLDVFGAGCCGGAILQPTRRALFSEDLVWLNAGAGTFRSNGQRLAGTGSNAVAVGDLDGDGYPDAFVAAGLSTDATENSARETANTVWFNDGQGRFEDSGQRLGKAESIAVALGDVDGDGDLDAVVGNAGRDELWLNDGQGRFHLARQRLGDGDTRFVFLVDLNEDSKPDLFIAEKHGGLVWLNDGDGNFSASDQRISYDDLDAPAVGDVTGDGLDDVFIAGVSSYRVWRGEGDGRFSAGPSGEHHEEAGEEGTLGSE